MWPSRIVIDPNSGEFPDPMQKRQILDNCHSIAAITEVRVRPEFSAPSSRRNVAHPAK
jgi:hypothetical protein